MKEELQEVFTHDATEYLLNNLDIASATAEVFAGDRFIRDNKPFTIRPMTPDEFETWQRQCSKVKFTRGKRESEFNNKRFNELVIVNCTLKPNFKDADVLKRAGCQTPEQFLNKALLSGEFMHLGNEISALSGFDKSLDEVKEEVKND